MFKILISYKAKKENGDIEIKKEKIEDFETFIEACHYAEDYGNNILWVLIQNQMK